MMITLQIVKDFYPSSVDQLILTTKYAVMLLVTYWNLVVQLSLLCPVLHFVCDILVESFSFDHFQFLYTAGF